ncbi:MAG: hypothetical protein ACO27F_06780, partial [Beijerinckiaceae bacterium]
AIGLVNEQALVDLRDDAPRPSALARLVERRFGVAGTGARDAAMRRLAGGSVGALFIFALAAALSGEWLIGLAAALADALLRPAARRLVKRIQARRDQKREVYADGGGI